MINILANDGISQTGIDDLKAKGFFSIAYTEILVLTDSAALNILINIPPLPAPIKYTTTLFYFICNKYFAIACS